MPKTFYSSFSTNLDGEMKGRQKRRITTISEYKNPAAKVHCKVIFERYF